MATEVAAPVMFPNHSPRRLQRGSRYSAVAEQSANAGHQSPPPSLYSLDSAFQLQEYIAQLVRRDPEDLDAIVKIPSGQSLQGDQGDPGTSAQDHAEVDQSCWVYEHLRRLAQDLTYPLITLLQAECTRQSCPEMKAGEWLYLCVAHGNGGAMEQCCAIDYILHTLDSATALLNSSRNFPSRIAIPNTSTRHFSSLARRLSRIFAHAYFHHRELFEQAEAENALYERFLLLVQEFQLVPAEFLVIPWEGRPQRRPKSMQDQSFDRSYQPYGDAPPSSEEAPRDFARPGPIPRSILSRDQEIDPNSEDAALMASPSGGSLGRRRTDTMYLTGDLALAALDPVLSGAQDDENLPDGELALEDSQSTEEEEEHVHAAPVDEEANEQEMVESVDPFEDETDIGTHVEPNYKAPDPDVPVDHVVVLGDEAQVIDMEDVVQQPVQDPTHPLFEEEAAAGEEKESWPETETLEKEAEEASKEGQEREDLIIEPTSTPVTEEPPATEEAVVPVEEKEEEKAEEAVKEE